MLVLRASFSAFPSFFCHRNLYNRYLSNTQIEPESCRVDVTSATAVQPLFKACSCPVKVSGLFETGLATRAEAKAHQAAIVNSMGDWEICKLADGQIDGNGDGGKIEASKLSSYGCSIICCQFKCCTNACAH